MRKILFGFIFLLVCSEYSTELLYSAVKGVAAKEKFVFASDNSENLVVIGIAESGRMKIAARFNLIQSNPHP